MPSVASQIAVNHFDRSKPFYPIVLQYVSQSIGIKELLIRGLVGAGSLDDLMRRIPGLGGIPPAGQSSLAEVQEGLRKLSGPLQLASEFQGNAVEVDIDATARELVANHAYVLASTMRSAGSLLILAHEVTKNSTWRDNGPLWEFLRHCRNAAAHGGRFNLVNGEPRRPARWGHLAITPPLQGVPLFKESTDIGLLSPGDPIRLLWDIERAYPQMSA